MSDFDSLDPDADESPENFARSAAFQRILAPIEMSAEQEYEGLKALYESRKSSCMSNWYVPLLFSGVPCPATMLVDLTSIGFTFFESQAWAYGEVSPELISAAKAEIRKAADMIGYPCFLRTGQTSAKHYWKDSCYVESPDVLDAHINEIVNFSGFVDLPCDVWAVRQILPAASSPDSFLAFDGEMPITKEMRFFIKDGAIEHIQRYWPKSAIEGHAEGDWEERFDRLMTLPEADLASLTAQTLHVATFFPGWWSIDWLYVPTEDKWYATDMAQGAGSYRWDDPMFPN